MEDKDMVIRFNIRVRELDRQYEKNNNGDFDNGVYHKYAYNQGKNKDENNDLKEETITAQDVDRTVLKVPKQDPNLNNYYLKKDEDIINRVGDYGFPKIYIEKSLKDNLNNHATTCYYLLCMDQNY